MNFINGILDVMIKIHGAWGADPGVADVCEQIKAAINK